jgi:hypothetical protein
MVPPVTSGSAVPTTLCRAYDSVPSDFGSADPVLPSFAPGEVLRCEVFQRDAVDEVVQAPSGGDVTDDEDPLPVPPQWQVGQEPADTGDGLPPAFAAGVGAGRGARAGRRAVLPRGIPVRCPVSNTSSMAISQRYKWRAAFIRFSPGEGHLTGR